MLLGISSRFKKNTSTKNGESNKPFFVLLNVAVGRKWPGNPDSTTQFPQVMIIDYVRVYQGAGKACDQREGAVNADTPVKIFGQPCSAACDCHGALRNPAARVTILPEKDRSADLVSLRERIEILVTR